MIYSHATLLLRIVDKVSIQMSLKTRVDGLWVNIYPQLEKREQETLDRLLEALRLIKERDPYRYARVLKETDRLSGDLVPGSISYWVGPLRRCLLSSQFILASSPEIVAAEIVRRTTFGLLARYKVADPTDLAQRHRVGEVCTAQAQAFASKLADGGRTSNWLEGELSHPPDLSNTAIRQRFLAGEIEMGREAGMPDWLVRAVQRHRARRRARKSR